MSAVFSFDAYTWDARSGRADFFYSLAGCDRWVETLIFPKARVNVPPELWERVLFSLHLMLGIGYYKTSCPPIIQIRSGKLTHSQAVFWNTVYQKGLGEFLYQNRLLGKIHVRFPFTSVTVKPIKIPMRKDALVQLGGGKDSLTSIALLQKMNKLFGTFSLGVYPLLTTQIRSLRLPHQTVQRRLDPKLLDRLHRYPYNGHVPVSAIYAWVGLALALRSGSRWLIASNERSANVGNIIQHGIRVNHQWSKSLEFERRFAEYVRTFLTPNVTYFSLLRPLSEFQIASLFVQMYPQLPIFSSCNKHFLQRGWKGLRWCGECPKCAFVFLMLASFLPKQRLIRVFQANLLNKPSMILIYQQLLGLRDHKPFDCVGTTTEVRAVFGKLYRDGTFASDAVMKALSSILVHGKAKFSQDWKRSMDVSSRHHVPRTFQSFLYDLR